MLFIIEHILIIQHITENSILIFKFDNKPKKGERILARLFPLRDHSIVESGQFASLI